MNVNKDLVGRDGWEGKEIKCYKLIVFYSRIHNTILHHKKKMNNKEETEITGICVILRLASEALVPGWDQSEWHDGFIFSASVLRIEMADSNEGNTNGRTWLIPWQPLCR